MVVSYLPGLICFFAAVELSTASIVKNNHDLEVSNGRTLYPRKSLLKFASQPGEVCKVQVVENEPMYQRVGEFTPKVFNCDYLKNSIRYQHNGSPLLSEDVVKLRVSRLLDSETIQETVYLRIHILDSECDVIKLGGLGLHVPEMNGVSNPITQNVVQFNYDRLFRTKCELRIATEKFNFPEVGQLVVRSNHSKNGRKYEPAGLIISDCDEFLLKGVRYQHLLPPTPDIDYIPLHVIIKDKRSRYILKQEYHWLSVTIGAAFPNEAPIPSYSNMNVLEVDQFVTTNLLSITMSAVDSESDNGKLMFNVTKKPEKGFIAHLDDESKEIDSFYQKDISDLKIAYQPPNTSFSERQTFIVEFIAYDTRFAGSRIIQVLLSVRVSHTSAPRISWNMGLTMLEGQKRRINEDCLQIVDSDSMHLVRITLAGGLQHGQLFVNDRPGYSFSWTEIVDNRVVYQHDDSDTTRDHVMFQVSDGYHSTRFKLPIEILPKDDSPPVLVNNVVFEVAEGQIIHIYTFMLESYDRDSSSDYVTFNITNPPKFGQIQKKKDGERFGWEVQKFEQNDLSQGNIMYKHMGDEAFEDSFDFVLIDSSKPFPNVSPLHTATVKITPVDDQPPKPTPDITRSVTVNETDVVIITSEMLEYIDEENPGSPLKYIVTSDFQTLDTFDGSAERDAGHLFNTDDMIMLMKAPDVPHLKMFSQDAIDHNKVAYMPPMGEIGISPLDVNFEYTVVDSHGTELNGEQFFITVLPVDNQAPDLIVHDLTLEEGQSLALNVEDIDVSDPDTLTNQLSFILTRAPVHGHLEKYGRVLSAGDSFILMDVEEFGILYTHDGSEVFFDSFELIATDGHQNSTTATVSIIIDPVNDEIPVFTESTGLEVNESSSSIIRHNHISATDLDTIDEDLIFEVVDPPKSGTITVDGRVVSSFSQQSVIDNRVRYVHNGEEIGYIPRNDVASFVVRDKDFYDDDFNARLDTPVEMYDLNITILPVNNRPPDIVLGSAIFDCDEGGRHALSSDHIFATDLDTPEENLVFKISTPEFGVVEDNTPREGYEKQISVPVTSFSLRKLINGNIFYVQSRHRGIEPSADTFLVSVTDGKHKSAEVPFLIAIAPTNDEPPEVQASNFSCGEGDMFSISDAVLSVVDLDVPADEVMIEVTSPPSHGMLFNEMEMQRAKRSRKRDADLSHMMHEMDHISEFSLREWSGHVVQPAYLHDGTENSHDKFELKISDGKHIHTKILDVNIVLVNDEKPTIVTNKGISLELGDSEILSNVVLYSTDADSSDDELVYILYSIPSQGKLQIKVQDEWRNLQPGDSFTERDVSNNLIRYLHTNVLSSRSRDSFRFAVTDGTWDTKRQNFEITIRHKERRTVHVATGIANVKEGDKVFITTDILSARDGFDRPEDISYEIVSNPVHGQVEYITNPYQAISIFSQLDLMSRKIIYRHQSKEDSFLDSFTVQAGNGIQTKEGVVTIQIKPVDLVLPTLVLFPSAPSREVSHLTVFRGASVSINDMVVTIKDPDTSKDHLRMVITSYPNHGSLILNHETLSHKETHEITLTQLENSELMYHHSGDESHIDRFSFTVADGAHPGYLVDGQRTLHPSIFNIRIEQLDDIPPKVTLNVPTTSIETLGSSQYGVYIDSHNLMATDEGSSGDAEILFSVTQSPSYGMLKKKEDNSRLTPTSEFTLSDLKTRKLLYIINGKLNVTNDSFTFDVQDDWGNVRMGNRFSMSWTRIEIVGKSLSVCENQNQSSVSIKRYGLGLSKSSFVGVKIVSLDSAEENRDFFTSNAQQIQFDPGVTEQKWAFRVRNDGIRERKERFKILLHSPVNIVLEPKRKEFTIVILDAESSACQTGSGSPLIGGKRRSKPRKQKNHNRKLERSGRRKARVLARDESVGGNVSPAKTRKYGKLGRPVTVSPSTYLNNGTHKVWQYHGIIPITIGEEPVPHERLPVYEGSEPLFDGDEELINDDPHQNTLKGGSGQEKNLFDQAHADLIPNIGHTPQSPSISQKCNIHMFDRLFFDPISGSLMRCNGAAWVPWVPSKLEAARPVQAPKCSKNWYQFENRCFYIRDGNSTGESWNSAQRKCREDFGAHLATLSSKKHMKWLRRRSGRQKLWIGLNKKLGTKWEWAGGDNVTFTNWKRGLQRRKTRPGRSRSNEADCTLSTERRKWIAKTCSLRLSNTGFVCMKGLPDLT